MHGSQEKTVTCCYEKPVWKTCDLAGKDRVFDLSYDVLIFAVCPYPFSELALPLGPGIA